MISVIIPIYNLENYLTNCLDSLLAQTYADMEVILVDDGSTDESLAICREYAAKDSRFKVIVKTNGGVSSARNTGLDAATGNFIAFVDGDDIVSPDYFECLLNGMQENTVLSMCMYQRICAYNCAFDEERSGNISYSAQECAKKLLRGNFPVGVWGGILRTDKIKGLRFPVGIGNNEDKYFLYCYLLNNENGEVVFSNDKLYGYYVRPDSATTSGWNGYTDIVTIADQMNDITLNRHPKWAEIARDNRISTRFSILKSILRSPCKTLDADMTYEEIKSEILGFGFPSSAGHRTKVEYMALRTGDWCYKLLVSVFYGVMSEQKRELENEKRIRQN